MSLCWQLSFVYDACGNCLNIAEPGGIPHKASQTDVTEVKKKQKATFTENISNVHFCCAPSFHRFKFVKIVGLLFGLDNEVCITYAPYT